jgi:predicted secreted protein
MNMGSNAFWAYGTILQMGDGATSESFANVAELTDINPPAMTKDSTEVTNYASPDRFREYIAGLKDGGSVSGEGNWLPNNATHDENTGLLASFNDDKNHNWKLVLPYSLGTFSFVGHVTAYTPTTPLASQGKLAFSIKISGKPAFI